MYRIRYWPPPEPVLPALPALPALRLLLLLLLRLLLRLRFRLRFRLPPLLFLLPLPPDPLLAVLTFSKCPYSPLFDL